VYSAAGAHIVVEAKDSGAYDIAKAKNEDIKEFKCRGSLM